MSVNTSATEWFIARDGAQHGPISDAEMRKFVELGHLRATDLVWCARLANWQTGALTFPEHFAPKPPPPAPAQPPIAPPPSTPSRAQSNLAGPPSSPAQRQPVGVPEPRITPVATPQPVAPANPAAPAPAAPGKDDSAWADAMRAAIDEKGFDRAQVPGNQAGVPRPAHQEAPGMGQLAAERAHPSFDDASADQLEEAPPQRKRRRTGLATAVVAVLLIVGGIGWFAWQNRAMITGASAIGTAITSATTPSTPTLVPNEQFAHSPYFITGDTKEQIDASLQRTAIWRLLKREFSDWYQEIVSEVEKMRAQKQEDRVVIQYLVNVIVTLRRRNANAALQASPDALKSMANAFVANLKQLASRDGATCYAFITHGEASPFMIELSRTPAFSQAMQRQMIAIFSAVVDARAGRKIHPNTRRTDYEALTEDLTKQRGWSQQDLATFSDPQKLSVALPDKVCSLVQDWFVSHLSLKDPELQTRLLAESLKPLVGG